MSNQEYHWKREFSRAMEPQSGQTGKTGCLYLIHKHEARRLHYDLRLELDGVLKSWAVPKGPSLDPSEKRLAVNVEDHPIEYRRFEGTIPHGEYGAGTATLWDQGEWESIGDPHEEYAKGKLTFRLHGRKLRGGWALVRLRGQDGDSDNRWLLVKEDDEEARRDGYEVVEDKPDSALMGRAVDEIDPGAVPNARAAPQPDAMTPQMPTLVGKPPTGDAWLHEIKYDGYRILCHLDSGNVRLLTRNVEDWTCRFPPVADAIKALPIKEAIVDGEVVALGEDGSMDFQLLQNALKYHRHVNLVLYAFDLPHCGGYDLTQAPLVERKLLLKRVLDAADALSAIRYSDHTRGQGDVALARACNMSLEGIVSKRVYAPYTPGPSRNWVKVKCLQRQEFVIGGYTDPKGKRTGFGALLLGYYDRSGSLVYSGKVGTGFTQETLDDLSILLREREQPEPPFNPPPPKRHARGVHWVRPDLVAEVAFTEWTDEGYLRHPSFRGLRLDKRPTEVAREEVSALE